MSERFDQYDGWAWLYDETMGPQYAKEQLAVLERIVLPRVKAGAEMLDLCCGTGELIRPLLERGFKVTGLDGSEEMLTRARINAPGAEYVLEDARTYSEENRFDAAFSTSASLNHIPTIDDLEKVFSSVCRSLKSDGFFTFDLNHPGQLAKWWRGRPLEGEIADRWAYMVTPRYDAEQKKGVFRVRMFTRPEKTSLLGRFFSCFKSPVYRLLSKPRFIGLRLAVIRRFGWCEPGWDHREIDFPVVGHDLDAVRKALERAGFHKIEMQTVEGDAEVDDNHSAHFICSKSPA
ncbi:MAG: methyltransferase type 11 [Verrucomicrobiales bacterium]|nr:methyltransferase type 11 [Verrucomicrobiales bacterium]|tara:strand:- start:4973 stop:5842 length:870 start_codon:yes stop_codon:yes gene_type:complete